MRSDRVDLPNVGAGMRNVGIYLGSMQRCKYKKQIGCIKKKKHTSHQSYLLGVKVLSERLKTVHEMLNGTCRMWVRACKTSVFIVPNGKLHQVKYVQFQKKKTPKLSVRNAQYYSQNVEWLLVQAECGCKQQNGGIYLSLI